MLFGVGILECYNELVEAVNKKANKGFTLIELLLVVAILGILSVISFSSFNASIMKGRDTQRKSDLAQLRKALEAFKEDWGEYPLSDAVNHSLIKGCNNSALDSTVSDCPADTLGFRYYKNGGEVVLLQKFPTDPVPTKFYYYEYDPASPDTYSLYASLENTQDKDVKKSTLAPYGPDTNGWSKSCGSAGTADTCNYKITNAGLQQ